MSTPTNVLLEKAKIDNPRERERGEMGGERSTLQKNLLAKLMVWGKEETKNKIREIEYEEMKEVRKYPKRQILFMSEA